MGAQNHSWKHSLPRNRGLLRGLIVLGGGTHEDPYRFRPGSRPWMWWAERGLLPKPRRSGEELLALKKLGVLVKGEWDAARSQLREMVLLHEGMDALRIADWFRCSDRLG